MDDSDNYDDTDRPNLQSESDTLSLEPVEAQSLLADDTALQCERGEQVFLKWVSGQLAWTKIKSILIADGLSYDPKLLREEYRTLAMIVLLRAVRPRSTKPYWIQLEMSKVYIAQLMREGRNDPKRSAVDTLRARMKLLVDAQLVIETKVGREVRYSASHRLIRWFKEHMVNGPFGDDIL